MRIEIEEEFSSHCSHFRLHPLTIPTSHGRGAIFDLILHPSLDFLFEPHLDLLSLIYADGRLLSGRGHGRLVESV